MAKLGSFALGLVQLLAGIFFTATGIGAGLGMKLILSGALTIATGLKTPTGRDGFESSPRYGFDNLNNVSHDGGPVPVIYGMERVAPQIVSMTTDQNGTSQVLRMLMLVCEGEIESITDVRINEVPADDFKDVIVETRTGTADQTVIDGFNEIGTAWQAGTKLTHRTSHLHAMRNDSDSAILSFVWPSGMYAVQKDGDIITVGVSLTFEIREEGKTTWIPVQPRTWVQKSVGGYWLGHVPAGGPWRHIGSGVWHHSAKTQSTYRTQMRVHFPSRGKWDVRVTGAQVAHERHINIPTLTNVVEILNDQRAYPNRALLALEIPASGQLSGGTPRVTCLVKGKKVATTPWDSSADDEWSRNPVWCLRDMLLNARHGLGGWLTTADMDDGSGGSWDLAAQACDAALTGKGYGNPHARHELDIVMDTKAPCRDWVSQIIEAARLNLWMADGLLRIKHLEAGSSVRTFSEDEGDGNRKNILAGTNSSGPEDELVSSLVDRVLPDPQQFNVVRVRYVDRYKDYRTQTLEVRDERVPIGAITSGPFQAGEEVHADAIDWRGHVTREAENGADYLHVVADPGYDDTAISNGIFLEGQTSGASATAQGAGEDPSPERVLEIQLFGVTRGAQALREARYQLNRAQLTKHHCTFAMFLGDQDLEPGDVITLKAARLGWTAKLFRVLSIQYAHDGTGRIDAREYDEDVFVDQVDMLEDPPLFTGPGDAVTPGIRPVAGSDSAASSDTTPPTYSGTTPLLGGGIRRPQTRRATSSPPPPARSGVGLFRSQKTTRALHATYIGWSRGFGK